MQNGLGGSCVPGLGAGGAAVGGATPEQFPALLPHQGPCFPIDKGTFCLLSKDLVYMVVCL